MPGKISLFLLLIFIAFGTAQTAKTAGGASNLLLRFEMHPRGSALSGAFTALADDDGALMYNPAGLSRLNSVGLSFYHAEWLEDIRMDYLAYAGYLTPKLGWGIGIEHMWMPSLVGKDNYGNATENFDVSSSVIQLGLSYRLFNHLHTGMEVKYFQDRLAEFTASGMAFDAGLIVDAVPDMVRVGLAVQNMGSKIKYDRAEQNIPLQYRGGVAVTLIPKALSITADAVKSIDTDVRYLYGAEYTFADFLSLRVGNRSTKDALFLPSFGMGLKIADTYRMDYSFLNLEDLGMTHRMGLHLEFGYMPRRATFAAQGALLPPAAVRLAVKEQKLIVYWTKVPAAKYHVYGRFESQKKWARLTSKPVNKNYIRFNLPKRSGTFWFYVTAVRGDIETSPSPKVSYTNKSLNRIVRELQAKDNKSLPVLSTEITAKQIQIKWTGRPGGRYNLYAWAERRNQWVKLNKKPLQKNYFRFKKPGKIHQLKLKVTSIINGQERAYTEPTVIQTY